MPFFRYSGTDKAGASVDGTVEAVTADVAMMQLVKSGVNVSQLMKTLGPPAAAPQTLAEPPKTAAPARPVQTAAKPIQAASKPPQADAVPLTPSDPIIKTKRSSDKELMFLFSQLSKMLKAGIGPAEAFTDLRVRVPAHISPSLVEAAQAATNGKPISDSMERYPYLYPESVVGTIRAGENGGFLVEACEVLSDQAQNAHAFRRMFWWVRPMIVNALIALPLVWLISQAALMTWKYVEPFGEGATASHVMSGAIKSLGTLLLWPIGPFTLFWWGLLYGLFRLLASHKAKMMRHEMALSWPVFGARTRHECLAMFSWTMAKLAKSGISPKRSWELATEAVPNLAVKERLNKIANRLSGAEKLSDAVFKEKLFPAEYAPLIATAEHTGDMPGAFDQLSKISKIEFDAAQTDARLKSGRWANAGCMLIGGIVLIVLFYVAYRQLLPAILEGLE
jgi:type IV pilus assembly protein PilC